MKRFIKYLILILLLLPYNIYAYSNKIYVGGETIGIEVNSNGVYIVGFYDVDGKMIAKDAGFKVGDIIKKVNDNDVSSIDDLNNIIIKDGTYIFNVYRNNNYINLKINLKSYDDIIKTGLYVKDTINGIGTLSYIDPETLVFGSLGHEIIESSSNNKFLINDGNIYKALVTSVKKSYDNLTGEKSASIDKNEIKGDIISNESNGIFGKYTGFLNDRDLYDVGYSSDIKKGHAYIRTVLSDDNINNYDINIISIDENDTLKNILFEIDDSKLIDEAGGIVQGMSGSPIIQNDKIIGVVNYVIVDDVKKGYGIFITSMLEEGDKILS